MPSLRNKDRCSRNNPCSICVNAAEKRTGRKPIGYHYCVRCDIALHRSKGVGYIDKMEHCLYCYYKLQDFFNILRDTPTTDEHVKGKCFGCGGESMTKYCGEGVITSSKCDPEYGSRYRVSLNDTWKDACERKLSDLIRYSSFKDTEDLFSQVVGEFRYHITLYVDA